MIKKVSWSIFILISLLLLTLVATTAFYRYQASQAFQLLTNYDPAADRDAWDRASNIYKATWDLTPKVICLYPVAALFVWFTDHDSLRKTLWITLGVFVLSFMLMQAVTLFTDGRVGYMDMNNFLFICLLSYLKVFLPCLLLWLIAGKIKKV